MTLSTGIRALDRRLSGGLPPGSLVVVTSPPQAQVDPLLHAGIHERPTRYFTTVRGTTAVRKELDRLLTDPEIRGITNVSLDGGTAEILGGIEPMESGEDVVVSVLDPLEESTPMNGFVSFLNHFDERLQAVGTVGFLHCLQTDDPPSNRRFTLAAADFVWQLRCNRTDSELTYTLELPKASGLDLEDDDRVMQLNLGPRVTIDTSRDIA